MTILFLNIALSTGVVLAVVGGLAWSVAHGASPPRVRSYRLVPTDDGWSLVAADGRPVFQAPGLRGRGRCLRFARAHGILTILS